MTPNCIFVPSSFESQGWFQPHQKPPKNLEKSDPPELPELPLVKIEEHWQCHKPAIVHGKHTTIKMVTGGWWYYGIAIPTLRDSSSKPLLLDDTEELYLYPGIIHRHVTGYWPSGNAQDGKHDVQHLLSMWDRLDVSNVILYGGCTTKAMMLELIG